MHMQRSIRARAFGAAYSNGAGKSSGVSSGKSSQGLASLQKAASLQQDQVAVLIMQKETGCVM